MIIVRTEGATAKVRFVPSRQEFSSGTRRSSTENPVVGCIFREREYMCVRDVREDRCDAMRCEYEDLGNAANGDDTE